LNAFYYKPQLFYNSFFKGEYKLNQFKSI
jgi:hypothetical protein